MPGSVFGASADDEDAVRGAAEDAWRRLAQQCDDPAERVALHRRRQRGPAPDVGVTMEAASSETAAAGGTPSGPTCVACGALLAEGFAFCESCGAPTGEASTVATSGVVTAGDPPIATPEPGTDEADGLSARTTLLTHPDDVPTQGVAPRPPAGPIP